MNSIFEIFESKLREFPVTYWDSTDSKKLVCEISKMNEDILKSLVNKKYDIESIFGIIPLQILPTRLKIR